MVVLRHTGTTATAISLPRSAGGGAGAPGAAAAGTGGSEMEEKDAGTPREKGNQEEVAAAGDSEVWICWKESCTAQRGRQIN